MKKLWKDNGGYALIYVLIVVLVLCAVAVSVCTAALKNYQAQEESVRQTRQLYQAEGEIEKFVALAEDVHLLEFSAEHDTKEAAEKAAKEAYLTYLQGLHSKVSDCTYAPPDATDTDSNSCTFKLTCEKNAAVRIETKIKMNLEYDVKPVEKPEDPQPDGKPKIKYTARVSKATHHYITYTITHLTAEKGGTSE